jgi:hypothetical protein
MLTPRPQATAMMPNKPSCSPGCALWGSNGVFNAAPVGDNQGTSS